MMNKESWSKRGAFDKRKVLFLPVVLVFVLNGVVYGAAPPKNGIHEEYFKSGELKSETNYKDGKKHGIKKIYDENGRLLHKVTYKNGKMIKSFSTEPERDLGPFQFVTSIKFWIAIIFFVAIIWFLFVKLVFKNKPF